METQSNKALVAQFYKEILRERNEALIDVYVREDYIQHSPSGKDGREGLREMIAFLKTLPPSTETTSPIKLLLADCDLVAALLQISFMGKQMLVLDLFRLQGGQLAEHWDAVQDTVDSNFDEIAIDYDIVVDKKMVSLRYDLLSEIKIHRIMGEGDIILIQAEIVEEDNRFARYDILRVANGEIVQLLNIRQSVPEVMMHDNGMF